MTTWFALVNDIYTQHNMSTGLKWPCMVELVPLHFCNDHEKKMLLQQSQRRVRDTWSRAAPANPQTHRLKQGSHS